MPATFITAQQARRARIVEEECNDARRMQEGCPDQPTLRRYLVIEYSGASDDSWCYTTSDPTAIGCDVDGGYIAWRVRDLDSERVWLVNFTATLHEVS